MPPHVGGGFGNGLGGGNEGDAKRRQQQEYAAALEQQRHERAEQMRESLDFRQGGGGDVFGGAQHGDARRQQQQQEYAAALQDQMEARQRQGRHEAAQPGQPWGHRRGGAGGGLFGSDPESEAAAAQRRQKEYAAELALQVQEAGTRKQAAKEARRRELELEAKGESAAGCTVRFRTEGRL